MTEDQKKAYEILSFKEARLKNELNLKDLSEELRISKAFLISIEEENYEGLPSAAYVKGYIRIYAKRLGLKPESALKSFDSFLNQNKLSQNEDEISSNFSFFNTSIFKKYSRLLLLIFIIFSFIGITINIFIKEEKKSTEVAFAEKDVVEVDYENEIKLSEINHSNMPEKENKITVDLLSINDNEITSQANLEFKFIGDSWLEVSDQNKSIEYSLRKEGSLLKVSGEPPFKILIGNVRNVELFFRDKRIDLMKSYNKKTNVGCVVLPAGECNEFVPNK